MATKPKRCEATYAQEPGVIAQRCGSPAKHRHKGKGYCGVHYPPCMEARTLARENRQRERFNTRFMAGRGIMAAREAVVAHAEVWAQLPASASGLERGVALTTLRDAVGRLEKARGKN